MDRKRVLVVDFNNVWNKYLFVRKGDFTDAIHSTLHFFRSIYQGKEFDKVFVILDGKPDTKYSEYKQYKANRHHNFDRYVPLKTVVSVLSQYFTVIGGKHTEGDEAVAYIASKLCNKHDVYIYSNDKDFIQLMNKGINIITDMKKGKVTSILTEEQALAKFKNNKGEPLDKISNVLKYRVFKGDSSDNISPACPRLTDNCIREILSYDWIEETLDENILKEIRTRVVERVSLDNNKYRYFFDNYKTLLTNWKLMDLCHLPDDFQKQIKKVYYKLDREGLEEYKIEESFFQW